MKVKELIEFLKTLPENADVQTEDDNYNYKELSISDFSFMNKRGYCSKNDNPDTIIFIL